MSQTEYLETAEKLYEIYKSNNIFSNAMVNC